MVTCGSDASDRAKKLDYCLAPACQEKNLKGLTMVAIGVNKAADQYLLLDGKPGTNWPVASFVISGEVRSALPGPHPAPDRPSTVQPRRPA